jgi:hypothetical protein
MASTRRRVCLYWWRRHKEEEPKQMNRHRNDRKPKKSHDFHRFQSYPSIFSTKTSQMRVFLKTALNRPAQTKSAGSTVHEKTGRFGRFFPGRWRGRSYALNKPARSPVLVFSGSTAGPVRFLKLWL